MENANVDAMTTEEADPVTRADEERKTEEAAAGEDALSAAAAAAAAAAADPGFSENCALAGDEAPEKLNGEGASQEKSYDEPSPTGEERTMGGAHAPPGADPDGRRASGDVDIDDILGEHVATPVKLAPESFIGNVVVGSSDSNGELAGEAGKEGERSPKITENVATDPVSDQQPGVADDSYGTKAVIANHEAANAAENVTATDNADDRTTEAVDELLAAESESRVTNGTAVASSTTLNIEQETKAAVEDMVATTEEPAPTSSCAKPTPVRAEKKKYGMKSSPTRAKPLTVSLPSPEKATPRKATPRKATPKKTRTPTSSEVGERLYARGMEIVRKREAMRRSVPEVGPFSPQLSAKTRSAMDEGLGVSSGSPSSSRPVFFRLYECAKEKQLRLEERREAAGREAAEKEMTSPSKQKRISARRAAEMYERSMKLKAETEKKREEWASSDTPTFTPVLETKGKGRSKDENALQKNVAERLYRSDHLLQRDERLQKAKTLRELEECTFSPQLVTRRKNASARGPAVFNRLYSEGKTLNLTWETKEALLNAEIEGTFAPDISTTQSKVKAAESTVAVHERLHRSATPLKERKDQDVTDKKSKREEEKLRKKRLEEEELAQCTFRPNTGKAQQSPVTKTSKRHVEKVELGAYGGVEGASEQASPEGATFSSTPTEVQTGELDVSLLDTMDSPKGRSNCARSEADVKCAQSPSAVNSAIGHDGSDSAKPPQSVEMKVDDTTKKEIMNEATNSASGKEEQTDMPQAYDSGPNACTGEKVAIASPGIAASIPGSVMGFASRSSESVGSIEFGSI